MGVSARPLAHIGDVVTISISAEAVHAAAAMPPCMACCQTWLKTLAAMALFSSGVKGGVGSATKILVYRANRYDEIEVSV
jgi:hypothetical protein